MKNVFLSIAVMLEARDRALRGDRPEMSAPLAVAARRVSLAGASTRWVSAIQIRWPTRRA